MGLYRSHFYEVRSFVFKNEKARHWEQTMPFFGSNLLLTSDKQRESVTASVAKVSLHHLGIDCKDINSPLRLSIALGRNATGFLIEGKSIETNPIGFDNLCFTDEYPQEMFLQHQGEPVSHSISPFHVDRILVGISVPLREKLINIDNLNNPHLQALKTGI